MILGNSDIADALSSGNLVIEPQPADHMISTSSVDLRVADTFTVFNPPVSGVDITVLVGTVDAEAVALRHGRVESVSPNGYLDVRPGEFVLAFTMERVEFPLNLAGRVEGKSSLGRLGLSIHQTAPTIQAGFRGHIRLEISNTGPFVCRLTPGTPICQLVIEELKTSATNPLDSQFQNQTPN